ncbi:MAG: WG repeat-containing protein [Flavobacteriaceae bacterium]|jgi:hypothetical protein|nr:WG repeat-containing protein [Flavobacteriaceae bacterium]
MKIQKIFTLLFIAVMVYSCGTYRINKTKDFEKLQSVKDLDGEYSGFSTITKKTKSERNVLSIFNLNTVDDFHRETDFFDLNFIEPNQIKISYWDDSENSGTKRDTIFTGIVKEKFLEIYFKKSQSFIPFLFSDINIDRVRIGKDNQGNLLVMKFYDNTGNLLFIGGGGASETPYIFQKAEKFEGLKPVKTGEKWGYIDKNNNIKIEPKYDFAKGFFRGTALVKFEKKWGMIDQNGNPLTTFKYDKIQLFPDYIGHKTFYKVFINNKIGILDALGTETVPPVYDEFMDRNEYFEVRLGNKYGLATREKLIFPAIYDKIWWYYWDSRMWNWKSGKAERNGKEYLLDADGYEYEPEITIRKSILFFSDEVFYFPKLETKRKVEFSEQESQ